MLLYKAARVLCRALLFTVRRMEVVGKENEPMTGGLLVVSNHTSYWDPVVMGSVLKREIRFMAKKELFNVPLLSGFLKKVETFPVDRGKSDLQAVKTALQLLKRGLVVGVFPEGTRSHDGSLLDPMPGVALLAIRAQVPVLPMGLIGTRGICGKVVVRVGKPVTFADYYGKKPSKVELEEVSKKIMEKIAALLDTGVR